MLSALLDVTRVDFRCKYTNFLQTDKKKFTPDHPDKAGKSGKPKRKHRKY